MSRPTAPTGPSAAGLGRACRRVPGLRQVPWPTTAQSVFSQASHVPGSITRRVADGLREVTVPLCLTLVGNSWHRTGGVGAPQLQETLVP